MNILVQYSEHRSPFVKIACSPRFGFGITATNCLNSFASLVRRSEERFDLFFCGHLNFFLHGISKALSLLLLWAPKMGNRIACLLSAQQSRIGKFKIVQPFFDKQSMRRRTSSKRKDRCSALGHLVNISSTSLQNQALHIAI